MFMRDTSALELGRVWQGHYVEQLAPGRLQNRTRISWCWRLGNGQGTSYLFLVASYHLGDWGWGTVVLMLVTLP